MAQKNTIRWTLCWLGLTFLAASAWAQDREFGPPRLLAGPFTIPGSIAVDPRPGANRVLVLETGAHRFAFQYIDRALEGRGWRYFGETSSREASDALNEPQGIAVDPSGNVFVADTFNNRARLYRYVEESHGYLLDTRFASETPTRVAGLDINRPRDIAVSRDGRVYLLDTGNRRVLVADNASADSWSVFRSSDDWRDPYGIAVGPDGSVYLADTGNHRIVKLLPDGSEQTFGTYGRRSADLRYPRDLAVSGDGRIYVADTHNHRIAIFNSDGTLYRSLGSAPLFGNIEKLAIDAFGRLFVADSERSDVVAYLGPDVDPAFDGFLRDGPEDSGNEPSTEPLSTDSPDILVRGRPDVDLDVATRDGLTVYGSDAGVAGETQYLYLQVHNRGAQALPPSVLRTYMAAIDGRHSFPLDWANEDFYLSYTDSTRRAIK